jgi:hypothetical protein
MTGGERTSLALGAVVATDVAVKEASAVDWDDRVRRCDIDTRKTYQ